MENISYTIEKNLKDFLQQNHFETFTYDKLIEAKEDIAEESSRDIPFETVDKIDNLIEEKKRGIKALADLEKLGYTFIENGASDQLVRSKISRRSDNWAVAVGSILSLFIFFGFFTVFSIMFNTAQSDFTFSTFVLLSLIFLIGGTGLILLAKGLHRKHSFKNFKISTDDSTVAVYKNSSFEVYPKEEFQFVNEQNGSKHTIYLKSKVNSKEIKDIFVFEFSNKAYIETIDYLISKLNS